MTDDDTRRMVELWLALELALAAPDVVALAERLAAASEVSDDGAAMLTTAEVARRLALSVRTLESWRRDRRGPAFVQVEGAVRYPIDALEEWAGIAEDLLDSDAVAARLGVSRRTVAGWRRRGCGPRFLRLGGAIVRYPRGAVEAWARGRQ